MTYAAACKLRLCARCWLASVLKDIRRLCRLSLGSEAHKRNSLGNGGTIKENGNTNPDSIVERNTKQGGCRISQCSDGRVFFRAWGVGRFWLYQFSVCFGLEKKMGCVQACFLMHCHTVEAHCTPLSLRRLVSSYSNLNLAILGVFCVYARSCCLGDSVATIYFRSEFSKKMFLRYFC